MNETNCSLIFTGEFVEGKTPDQAHEKLAEAFKTDTERIQRMFAQKGNVIKKNADRETCLKMQKMIYDAGAVCVLDPPEISSDEATEIAPEQAMAETKPQANPYAAPKSNLKTDEDSLAQGFMEPQKKSAGRGAAWIFQAVSLFIQRPFKWILITIVYFLVSMVIGIIPVLNILFMALCSSVFYAGFMIGGKELEDTGELSVGCLFRGFKQGFGSLVLLNILMICTTVLIVGLCMGIGYALLGMDMAHLQNQMAGGNSLQAFGTIAILYLFILVLIIPVMMAYLFAPALISINGNTAFEAFKTSFSACLKNWLPFLVYGLAMMIFTLIISAVVGGIFGASFSSAMAGRGSFALSFIVGFIIGLALMPIGILTIYTAYKDIFYNREGSV